MNAITRKYNYLFYILNNLLEKAKIKARVKILFISFVRLETK